MAALRPCPSIITALASSNLDRSQPHTRGIVLPLDRSNSTLKISRAPPGRSSTLLKSNHGIRAHRDAAGDPFGPKPDPEELMRKYMTPEQQKIWDECIKLAKGPPDRPFREEIDILSEYWHKVRDEIFYDKSILHPGTASLSWTLCSKAHHAAVLASRVVDCALLRHGKDEISVHTTKQTMRTYVSVFVSTAEDSYHKKVRMETTFPFLARFKVWRRKATYWSKIP
ncbi:uncharacterized protein LOC123396463 [Hordeum vulgare subsp. vulgare]|uniref:uncharacterized protein LOC123396463 n=1 Tax=Hordeum vulgare subsp. vulgare TaxID=112509 RepID=UPI001D1A3D1A|nr:uncharacterized protein LOC123396463 [Hordeum vulgare subsp. vulgare]